jgi:hypothetical protein
MKAVSIMQTDLTKPFSDMTDRGKAGDESFGTINAMMRGDPVRHNA